MKRISLLFGLPLLAGLVGLAAPRAASAHEARGRGHNTHVVARDTHVVTRAGWRAPVVVNRPAYVATPPRFAPPRPVYVGRGHAAAPTAGHWGWHGPRRVWFGVATIQPYAGWIWTPAAWVWDGYQWIWQEGYWAPPV